MCYSGLCTRVCVCAAAGLPNSYEVALVKGTRGLGAGFGSDWTRDMPLSSFQGLFVAELLAGGLAVQAGCVLPGDRLVQVNRDMRLSGRRRPHMSHLVASVRDTAVGDTVCVPDPSTHARTPHPLRRQGS